MSCTCKINSSAVPQPRKWIDFCPLHASAQKMNDLLEAVYFAAKYDAWVNQNDAWIRLLITIKETLAEARGANQGDT